MLLAAVAAGCDGDDPVDPDPNGDSGPRTGPDVADVVVPDCEPDPPSTPGEGRAEWADPVPLGFEELDPAEPWIAASDEDLHVAFVSNLLEGDEITRGEAVYAAVGGETGWSDPELISSAEKMSLEDPRAVDPRVSLAPDGSRHLLWGEIPDPGGVGASPDEIWHSTDRDGEWSAAERVVVVEEGPSFSDVPRGFLFEDGGGPRMIVESRRESPRTSALEDARAPDGRSWTVEPIPRSKLIGGLFPDPARDDDGRLLLTFVWGLSEVGDPPDFNSVWFTWSEDDGESWAPAHRVLRAGEVRAFETQIVQTGDGRIHLIWGRDAGPGASGPRRVQHSHSDDGECWSDPVTLPPTDPGTVWDIRAVPDEAGGIHLVYRRSDGFMERPLRLMYLYWDGFQWSEPEALFDTDIDPGLGLDRGPDGRLHLVYALKNGEELFHAEGH